MFKQNPEKYFLTDQFNNEDNMNAHYNLTGPHIIEQL
jgi:cysteine synthase